MPHDLRQPPAQDSPTPAAPPDVHRLVAGVGETLYRIDTEGRILWAAGAVRDLLGVAEDEVVGVNIADLYAEPKDREEFLRTLGAQGGSVSNYEVHLRHRDGHLIWVSVNAHYWHTTDGAIGGVEGIARDITDQRRVRSALVESEQRFRTLAETSGSVVFMYRERFLYANQALEALLGYSRSELQAMRIADVVHPDDRALVLSRSRARLRGDPVPARYEVRVVDRKGEAHWLEVSAGVISVDGRATGMATGFDITQRKHAEQALRESEQNLAALTENATDAILVIVGGYPVFANRRAATLLGYDPAVLTETRLEALAAPDALPELLAHLDQFLDASSTAGPLDTTFVDSRGGRVPVALNAARTVWKGQAAGLLFLRDVSERKRMEGAVNALAASTAAISDDAFLTENLRELTRAFGARFGFIGVFDDDTKRAIRMLVFLDDGETLDNIVYTLEGTPCAEVVRGESRLIPTQVGELYPADAPLRELGVDAYFGVPMLSASGQPVGLIAVMHCEALGITPWSHTVLEVFAKRIALELERQRTLRALRQSEERFSKVFHADAAGIAISRKADGTFVDANDNFLRLCGHPRNELIGRSALDLGIWPDPDQRTRLLEELTHRGSVREVELELRARSGDQFTVLCSIEPIEISGEACLLYIGHDVSDRNQAQADLRRQSARLRLITAITGCANEVRNLDEVLTRALDHICVHTGWPVGHAFLLDPIDQARLRTSRIWHFHDGPRFEVFRQATESVREAAPGGLPARVLAERGAAWISDIAADPQFRRKEAAARCGLRSAFAFPILVGNQVAGVMEFFNTERAQPDPGLLEAMSHVGVQLGRAVERGRAEQALRRSESRYRLLVDHASDAIFIAQDGVIKFPNPRTMEMFGFTQDELARRPFLELIAEEDRAMVADRHARRLRGEQPPGTYAFRVNTADTSQIWVELSTIVIEWEGRPATLNILRDVDAHKRAQDELFHEKERAQVTLQSIGDGVITTDPIGRVQYMNPAATEITGWTQEDAHDKPLRKVLYLLDESTRVPIDSPVDEALNAWCGVEKPGQVVMVRHDGRELAIEYSASPIRDRDGSVVGVIVVFRDVTEIRGMARQLSHQATHDSLTGLINRHEFENRLEHALASSRQENKHHAMCYLDLDQFKVVNDTCGHIAGDELLKQLGQHLHARVRDVDTLARLGGDEFGVLLEGCPLAKAQEIAEGLRQAIREFRFVWEEKSFEIGASIGVAPIDETSGTKSEVLSAADAACYVAKDLGRNRVHVYQPDDTEMARRHGEMQWVSRISRGLEEDRFELYFQPIFDLREAAGARRGELLVRMRDDDGELIPPMAFIPAAERYSLMPALDRWVVRTAFRSLAAGTGPLDGLTQVMINLSGQSLSDDGFLHFVLEEIRHHGIDTGRICFEITETAAIANLNLAVGFIDRIKELGCQFALDDFGAGLSSFAYLKNLRVDYLKIYGHFVRDMVNDPIDYAMVEAINHVGHVLGIETIAEFVENRAVLDAARKLGIDYAQGVHLGHPAPLSAN